MQIRIPSMLIRRDGLTALYPMAHNFETLLGAKQTAPKAVDMTNVPQQSEVLRREDLKQHRTQMIAKATNAASDEVKYVAKKWLSV